MLVDTIDSLAEVLPNLSTAFMQKLPTCAFITKLFDFLLTTFAIGVLSFHVAPLVTFWNLISYQDISKSVTGVQDNSIWFEPTIDIDKSSISLGISVAPIIFLDAVTKLEDTPKLFIAFTLTS